MSFLPWPNRIKSLLLTCNNNISIAKTHALIISTGLFTHGSSNGQLIASYARVGDIVSARNLFQKLPNRGVDVWNAIIIAYSRRDLPVDVLKLYKQMVFEGVKPDSSTFTVALKASAKLSDLEMGEEIRQCAVDSGYECDLFVGSSVLSLYVKCGKMDEAVEVFDKMPRRDLICWTTLIMGFAQNGRAREAVDVYREMQMERIEGDGIVMLGLIQACGSFVDSKLGLSVHGYMIRRNLPMDVVIQTSFVDMYAKTGHLELASHVFKRMSSKNVISWGAIISGFAQNGFASESLEWLMEMQIVGFKPDTAVLVSALIACSQLGYLKFGKSIHGYIVRRHDFDEVSGTAVIDMYSKCGALSCARVLFDRTTSKDLISWNAMIASYGIHGLGEEALSLFFQMRESGLKPDHATFASLLSALSHSGFVEEGKYWFHIMVDECKIQPSEKHYACVVDLLARAGQVEEAYQIIKSMNCKPGIAVWVALLSGCHTHRKMLIGEMAAKQVLELNPDDLGIYSLVSNFFAMAKKWEEVAGMRKIMRETGMRKVPGCSVAEVNGELHAFLMEDKRHHQHEDIMQILDKLDNEMKAMGYVLMTDHEMEGKEA